MKLRVPTLSLAQRNALSAPAKGTIIRMGFNGELYGYDGKNWELLKESKMKMYKHKKTGNIVEKAIDLDAYYYYEDDEYFPSWLIEDSCDWEEIIEKEWEVVKYGDLYDSYVWDRIEGTCWMAKEEGEEPYKVDVIENNWKSEKILAVKRLSDGEVFSIGDKVYWEKASEKNPNTIQEFKIEKEKLHIYVEPMSYYEENKLANLIKVKTPLLVTEDGVEIFDENQIIYWSNTDYTNTGEIAYKHVKGRIGIYFSSKEKRDEYVKMNKIQYSVKDLEEKFKTANLYPFIWEVFKKQLCK